MLHGGLGGETVESRNEASQVLRKHRYRDELRTQEEHHNRTNDESLQKKGYRT